MKTKLALILIGLAVSCVATSAQSVVITGKKVTYTRPKPISEGKETFTINYPKVKASTPALSKKIETAISYGIDLKEEINDAQWLYEADYEVGYNRNGVLSIALTVDGSGAYPSGYTTHKVVDLKTGRRVQPSDVFKDLPGLLKQLRKAKDKEVAQAIIDIKKDPENAEPHPEALFKEHAKYNPLKLNDFSVGEKGVIFFYDYGFPHVIEALQPPGEFVFTWKQLKPYIKTGSLLSRIAR